MKKLASALARALRESSIDRSLLLTNTDIGAPAMSRYLTGKATPTPESLVKIMSELPEQQALDVFSAYIQEIFPKKLSNKINLIRDQKESNTTLQESNIPYGYSKKADIDNELEDSLDLLRELSLQRQDIKAMLIQLSDVLRGK